MQPSRQLQSTLKAPAELATKTPHTPSRICQPWALGARSDPCERAWKARCGPQSRVRPHAATLNPAEQKEASSQERGERPPEEQASGGWPCPGRELTWRHLVTWEGLRAGRRAGWEGAHLQAAPR